MSASVDDDVRRDGDSCHRTIKKKLKAIEDLNLNVCHKIQNVHSLIDNISY